MKQPIRFLGLMILILGLVACQSGPAAPGNDSPSDSGVTYTVKVSHDLLDTSAQHVALQHFKELVEDKSQGRLKIDIFPNNTLGTDTEVAEYLQTGSVEAALIPTAKLSGIYPPLQVLDLPFFFPSREVLYQVLDSQEFKDLLFEPMKQLGYHGINFWESGYKQFTANKLIEQPADFKGLDIRTMESPLIISQFRLLGANPVPIDFGETYNSLQQGVVDGQENPLVSITKMKFYEVQSNMIISNHAYLAYAFLFSQSFWEKLPEDLQQIVLDAAEESVQLERQLTIDNEAGYIDTIKQSGTTVTQLSEEDIAEFMEAMLPLQEEFKSVITEAVLTKTRQLIDQFNQ